MTFLKTVKQSTSKLAMAYANDTKGNFAIIFAVSLFVIVGGLAASIDIGNAVSQKQRLQDTTDQISLYAAKTLETDTAALNAYAQDYVDFNYPNTKTNIIIENISRDGDTVSVQATTKVKTAFAHMLGMDQIDVRVNSASSYNNKGLDIALVLDSTGSMSGEKLDTLRDAATNLVSTLESGVSGNVRISVVPFAQYVNIGTDNADENWLDTSDVNAAWAGCVGSRNGSRAETPDYNGSNFPALATSACNTAITPLTDDLDAVKVGVNNMIARGLTYMPSGLVWGWRTLDGDAPFREARDTGGVQRDRIMVMMTDGTNTRASSGKTHDSKNINAADRDTRDLCNGIKSDGIKMYTIAYELDDSGTRSLLRRCASQDDNFFDARDASDLNAAFSQIASNLTNLRLTN